MPLLKSINSADVLILVVFLGCLDRGIKSLKSTIGGLNAPSFIILYGKNASFDDLPKPNPVLLY
ncbi:330L [Invertebrate iridescent virus Kaz2018]|uniref:330L n=2 Tax=Iridovirus TaxID=10487 RepID=Q91FJ4_IIV6|nr:330L [Invertebrate iridescent virus 6]AAK82191.1 330L [Invertebrate iridescent virus 6]QMS79528.1 hypothetical protein IIV6-T1_323 [Invertebrate iridescent virus 6]QNH08740.1 330L [Invertebrate iridescent virus Kaz2018]